MELVKKKAVVVNDDRGFPNFMTMFYMEPGTYASEDIPDMFKVDGRRVAAVLISQYTNADIKGTPVSMPYQMPVENKNHDTAARMCRSKGAGWHLMTNAEYVYLLNEADRLGHKISGNTDFGKNADNPEERGVCYDGYTTLTGLDPLAWSHDGTKDGVFGLCGNFWEHVAGVRLHRGVIEYIKDNDAAAHDYGTEDAAWKPAEADGKLLAFDRLPGRSAMLTDGEAAGDRDGIHMKDLQFGGSLTEVPEIIYRLGLLPRDYKERKDGLYIDSREKEAVLFRGSSFNNTSNGGAAALNFSTPRSNSGINVAFRSALYLDNWELIIDLLART